MTDSQVNFGIPTPALYTWQIIKCARQEWTWKEFMADWKATNPLVKVYAYNPKENALLVFFGGTWTLDFISPPPMPTGWKYTEDPRLVKLNKAKFLPCVMVVGDEVRIGVRAVQGRIKVKQGDQIWPLGEGGLIDFVTTPDSDPVYVEYRGHTHKVWGGSQ